MPLLDLKTNLKSLKFGFDLPAGGSSKQPFVEKPIPSDEESTPGSSPDYLLRQGTLRRIADDETRFFKYFQTPQGLAFIGKQNLLSLTSVRTQASQGPSNQGTYLPTNTSAQLAANPFGGHLNFLGVDPTGLLGGIRKYGEVITPTQTSDDNRLVTLQNNLINKTSTGNFNFVKGTTINPLLGVLYNYRGGPGAVEGRGKTNIYRYSETGRDNPLYKNNRNYFLGKNNGKIHTPDDPSTWETIPLGATDYYNGMGLDDLGQSGIATPSSFLGSTFFLNNIDTSVYKSGSLEKREDLNTYLVGKQYSGLEELKENRKNTTSGPQGEYGDFKVTNGVSSTYNRLTGFNSSLNSLEDYGIIGGDSSPTLRNLFSVYKSGSLEEREDLNTYLVGKKHTSDSNKQSPLGALNDYFTKGFGENLESPNAKANIDLNAGLVEDGDNINTPSSLRTVYKDGTFQSTEIGKTPKTKGNVWSQNDIINYTGNNKNYYNGGPIQDFRKLLRDNLTSPFSSIISKSPDYVRKNYETRTSLGNPGKINKNLISYTSGLGEALDKINALPLYQSTTSNADDNKPINDLVKFRIASVDNDKPTKSVYMHFRAFIDSFSDSYTTQWSGERYPGRGEEFFRYGGFGRGISLSFTVAAQSKEELIPMYKKLNFLASNTMNDYSESGYMRAPFIRLTVGGYLYEQFGFLKGINYGWEMAAPFEIGINDEGTPDSNVKELPHVIKVTGFDFQPIYDFLPQKQKNTYDGDGGDVSSYGPERYIALKASDNNYSDTIP